MRPSSLDPLFAPLASLPGIGAKTSLLLDRLLRDAAGPARVVDLLFHVPHATIDRRNRPKIAAAPLDQVVTLEAKVVAHYPSGPRARAPYRVLVEDDSGDLLLVFFLANPQWIEKSLPVGERRWISGKLELWDGHRQMIHPDRVLDEAGLARLPPVEPVYGLCEGLHQRILAKAAAAALARVPALSEWHRADTPKPPQMPDFREALQRVHAPQDPADILPTGPARLRLAYDELFAHQLALALLRASLRRQAGRPHRAPGRLAERIIAALPFAMTAAQTRASEEIRRDLEADARMLRLLQGDVGSGKTVVALLAMAHVVEAGRQAALMAPTEILARQHYESVVGFAAAAGLRVALLTGRDKPAERAQTRAGLAEGTIDIVIGTHALFQESVAFRDLGLAVVDEQHRFGVYQRLALGGKGEGADMLVMTATPIPRTLVLTLFGDMDISTLREKPPGRQSIETRALPLERLDEVIDRLKGAVGAGARAYWVCPLVAESEDLDVAAAEDRFESLRQIFGEKVGLLHGKMKAQDKDRAIDSFSAGETQILVATTVIEVGVDVPEASIIIIEHAERFGLAQLHQLRGRVGRGDAKSFCLLLYKAPLGEIAKARIAVMRETQDGFLIAEEDLRLRGEGEVLGTRQSGGPGFKLAELPLHADLLMLAREEARRVMAENAELAGDAGQALRILLYIFERDTAVKLLRAG